MACRRQSDSDLNFDGLTDTVTNLVGSLVLLVVLVVGATQAKVSGQPEPAPANGKPGAEVPIDDLLQQIRNLSRKLDGIEVDIATMQSRIPELEGEIDELRLENDSSNG